VLLTITSTAVPATDLGYLLFKHPARLQSFDLPVGVAHVFYPEATEQRCTAALLLEVDPIGLVRGRQFGGADAFSLGQYVNDRPYAASSMLAVALGRVFKTAMTGRCDSRPDLVGQPLPLQIHLPALPCTGGAEMARRLFEPMGWSVSATAIPADPAVPRWGDSRYVDLLLTGDVRLVDALHHLYVLLPVLDDAKHYWVGTDEIDKLIRAGAGWLASHPERELITRRYLAHDRRLVVSATGRLAEIDDVAPETLDNAVPADRPPDQPLQARTTLTVQRRAAVLEALRAAGAASVVDMGCGEGTLLRELLGDVRFTRITGADVSARALQVAGRRLGLAAGAEHQLSDHLRERITLLQSSVVYQDDRLRDHDAMVLMEVIEHVDPPRLGALQGNVFGAARPATVVITTPNAEYNVRYPDLPPGSYRHRDHRFEWTRDQFREWSNTAALSHGYTVEHSGIGDADDDLGAPTQLAVFSRVAA
jgi:3' terminal RNA ribose 2'-O-methyltransferase Hen1